MGNRSRRYDLFAIAVVFALAIVFEYEEAFSLIEDETLSYRQILRTHLGDPEFTRPHDEVLIVYTDELFYEEYGAYPLRRVDLATIVRRLSEMSAAVIGVDILLDFNSAYGEDPALEAALAEAGNVLLVSQAEFVDDQYVTVNRAIEQFDQHTTSGYSNISANSAISESIVRLRIYPQIARDGEWPFAIQAVANYLASEPELEGSHLSVNDIDLSLDQFNDLYIDYPLLPADGEGGTVNLHDVIGLPASDVLFAEDEEELAELGFLVDGRIVLIGEVAEVAHDEFETPVGNVYGVEVIANTVGTILRDGPLRAASFVSELVLAGLMLALLLVTARIPSPMTRNLVSFGIVTSYVLLVCALYIYQGLVVSMSYVLIASLIAIGVINVRFYLEEMGQKAMVRDAFGQYLSPKVVSELLQDPSKLSLGGEEREMTAFFSDIASFSTFSEKMSPTELVNMLNNYLTEMCNIILAEDGTVDKFEGDAIIAFWGAPAIQQDHAKRACFAAIDMRERLGPLNERIQKDGYSPIGVRMGLNSGAMVVGNMGSAQRLNYTIMGDAVNTASRLEGANKAYRSGTMISESTYAMCLDDVDVRELDRVRVVGKNEPITVYQLLARKNQTTGLTADLMVQFEKARQLYCNREFEAAMAAFRLCTSIDPDDGPSNIFLARCESYIESPPLADWDGVFVLSEKG